MQKAYQIQYKLSGIQIVLIPYIESDTFGLALFKKMKTDRIVRGRLGSWSDGGGV